MKRIVVVVAVLGACADVEESRESSVVAELSSGARAERSAIIRDVAARRGLSNGALLAGIADAETGMAHCWSEATWACQGPWSSSCNGPVIAGAGDGPCSWREGGLGMFQFDGGNFDQTLARDGAAILTVEGNADHAIDFVIAMLVRSSFVQSAVDAESALAFMNDVPIAPGDWRYEAWISTVTLHYNGCPPGASCWASRRARYSALTTGIFWEVGGPEFWAPPVVEPPPPPPEPTRAASRGCGGLESHEHLWRGEGMKSCNGSYVLAHQDDGNVVLYNLWSGAPVWATHTEGWDTSSFAMQNDGNLVLYSGTGEPIWASETFGWWGATLELQDDGNLVIHAPAGPVWQTGTVDAGNCGTFGSGSKLLRGERVSSCSGRFAFIHQDDGNVVLYDGDAPLWSSQTDGKATSVLVMQSDGNLVLYADDGSPIWDTGTWGHDGAWLAVQEDGNAVIYDGGGAIFSVF